ncbi:hypothetical protein [Hydrogenivirga sp.]
MKVHIVVVSKTPPGGRCEFYDRTFFELVKAYENVYYTLIPSNLYDGEVTPPAVLVNDRLVEPEDAVLLTPEELLSALEEAGAKPRKPLSEVRELLSRAYDEFIGGV